jgi:hypothetical protein
MRGAWRAVLAGGVLLMATAAARGGVETDLIFLRVTGARAASLSVDGGKQLPVTGEARVLVVERADPLEIKPGEFVSGPKEPGDGAPLWLLIGPDAASVARLAQAAGIKTPEAKRVGGIGTCTLYTPCPKCRAVYMETLAKRRLHPPAVRVKEAGASSVHAGQYVIAGDVSAEGRPLLVLEDLRTGDTLNEVRHQFERRSRRD